MTTFADWLNKALRSRRWTAAELTRQTYGRITPAAISGYRTGQHSAGLARAEFLSRVLRRALPADYRPWGRANPRPQEDE